MARVLVCLDAQALPDGSCDQTAFVELNTWADLLPDVQFALDVGVAYMSTLMVVMAVKNLFKPRRDY